MAFSSGNQEARAVPPQRSPAGETPLLRKFVRGWLWVCAAVAILFSASQIAEIPWRSALRGYDNTFNYLWLRSAMVDGDWDFRNDLAACDTLPEDYRTSALGLPPTPAGRIPNKYGIGWAVLSVPFYLVADGIVVAGRALGLWTLERDGWNPVYQICIHLGHVALALLALRLAVQVVAAWTGRRLEATAGVLLVWAASPLIYYQTANVSMSHGAAFLAVTLFAWALVRAGEAAVASRGGAGWWLLAGAAWSFAVTTRFQLGIFGLLAVPSLIGLSRRRPANSPGVDDAMTSTGTPAKEIGPQTGGSGAVLRAIALFVAGAGPLVFLQLLAWRSVYGAWLVFSYGAEGEVFHWTRPALFSVLGSPWHGLFYWHPFLAVASVALLIWARFESDRWWLLVLVALTIYLNASWWCWWFASAFGSRSFDAALLPLMAAIAWVLPRLQSTPRTTLLALGAVGGAWNFYLLLLYRTGTISRADPVSWWDMLAAAARVPASLHY